MPCVMRRGPAQRGRSITQKCSAGSGQNVRNLLDSYMGRTQPMGLGVGKTRSMNATSRGIHRTRVDRGRWRNRRADTGLHRLCRVRVGSGLVEEPVTEKQFTLEELQWIQDMSDESTGFWPEFYAKVARMIQEEKNDADKSAKEETGRGTQG